MAVLFLKVYAMIFLAELGDKSQLAALSATAQTPRAKWVIFGALGVALTFASLLAVIGGDIISRIPNSGKVISSLAGVLFIFFGCSTFWEIWHCEKEKCACEENCECKPCREEKMVVIFSKMFLVTLFAEMGDKTQISALSVAAKEPGGAWVVFAATSLALISTSFLAVIGGDLLSKIPNSGRIVQYAAGSVFLLFGIKFLVGV